MCVVRIGYGIRLLLDDRQRLVVEVLSFLCGIFVSMTPTLLAPLSWLGDATRELIEYFSVQFLVKSYSRQQNLKIAVWHRQFCAKVQITE